MIQNGIIEELDETKVPNLKRFYRSFVRTTPSRISIRVVLFSTIQSR